MSENNLEIITLKKAGIKDFSKERNELLKKSKAEWVFFLDSDEVISPELRAEITAAIRDKNINGFYVYRRDFLFGRELRHGEFSGFGWFGNSKLIRLGRRTAGRWERPVHELWRIKGPISTLKNPLLHYPHQSLRSFIENVNYFSGLHAKALLHEGKKPSLLRIIIWPPGKFIYNMIFRLGFLDGGEGFLAAFIMSFHSFLAWSKLWLLRKD